MNLFNKHPKTLGFISIIVSIFLFMPLIQTIMIAGFLAIMDSDQMHLSTFFLTVSESFIFRYYFNLPAIVLLILGIIVLNKK